MLRLAIIRFTAKRGINAARVRPIQFEYLRTATLCTVDSDKIEKGKEKEILYEESLKPGSNYYYLPDKNKTSGRTYILKEEN